MSVTLNLQIATKQANLPTSEELTRWATAALQKNQSAEITLRIVDEEESATLNQTYRQKPHATNVLTFPAMAPIALRDAHLGDIVICAPLVIQEANIQKKTLKAHFAHLIVHSVLHLQKYDHQTTSDAKKMEALEVQILQKLGFTDPYGDTPPNDR